MHRLHRARYFALGAVRPAALPGADGTAGASDLALDVIVALIGAFVFKMAGAHGTLALLAAIAAVNVLLVAVLWTLSRREMRRLEQRMGEVS